MEIIECRFSRIKDAKENSTCTSCIVFEWLRMKHARLVVAGNV